MRAIDLDPELAMAYAYRGLAYIAKGEFDKGIENCNVAIELDPNNAWAYLYRSAAYHFKGEESKAVIDLERCIELSTDPALTEWAQQLLEELGK